MTGYLPPQYLRGPHVQSVLAGSVLRRLSVRRAARDLLAVSANQVVDCGRGVRLLVHLHESPAADRRQVAVLIHGWEGSADSSYVLSAALRLWYAGYRIVRLNLRDHGDSVHLNRGLFHSCRLGEVIGAVQWVQRTFPGERLTLGGYSLGGNFALRVAAQAGRAGLDIDRVAAVCPVLDPAETMRALDDGPAVYRWYFIRKWRRSLERKKAAFPDVYRFDNLRRFTRLEPMTDYFVRHYTEYSDLESYLRGYALTGDRLEGLTVPARVLLAGDDPVIPAMGISRLARPAALRIDCSPSGGHCGFLSGPALGSWADGYIERALRVNPRNRSREF